MLAKKVIDRLSQWLERELSAMPETVRAIYVEFDYSYGPNMEKSVAYSAFGFDEESPEDLGLFGWESRTDCSFHSGPEEDWVESIAAAMRSEAVQQIAEKRNLYLACAEHDCEVAVIRRAK